MTKVNIYTLISIVILTGGFAILDYRLFQFQDFNAAIGDATAITAPAILSSSPVTSSDSSSVPVCVLKQYKLLENADECRLGAYGKKGWGILQAGSVVEQSGRGADCSSIFPFIIDWVILEKGSTSHTCF